MTKRLPCPPAPGPLEAYASRFDDLFGTLAQRRGFREYLAGLLAPGTPGRPWLADALGHAATLLAGMVDEAPQPRHSRN
jgi:hypothetical protein